MINVKKGKISFKALGKIVVSGGASPQIEIANHCIEKIIAEQLGMNPEEYKNTDFYGRLTIVLECLEDKEPVIKNTMIPNLAEVPDETV